MSQHTELVEHDLIERLRWVRSFVSDNGKVDYAETCQEAIEALSVNPLREALEPFADALEEWGEDELTEDGRSLWDHPLGMCITVGDFRAARKALGEQQP